MAETNAFIRWDITLQNYTCKDDGGEEEDVTEEVDDAGDSYLRGRPPPPPPVLLYSALALVPVLVTVGDCETLEEVLELRPGAGSFKP